MEKIRKIVELFPFDKGARVHHVTRDYNERMAHTAKK